jgi:hypothetical protein
VSPASGVRTRDSAARPIVLALTGTPLLTDLLRDLLDQVAVVRHFPAGSPDLEGLVRHTMPNALVIDSDQDALELAEVADELSMPLVRIALPSHEIQIFRDGGWDPVPFRIESPTTIRNLLLGELFNSPAGERESLPGLPAYGHHGLEG